MTDHAELRRLASSATPGERDPATSSGYVFIGGKLLVQPTIQETLRWLTDADLAFIAAANPQAVLALLDRIEELESERRTAWIDGMGVGYKAGKEPAWIPPECPYPKAKP